MEFNFCASHWRYSRPNFGRIYVGHYASDWVNIQKVFNTCFLNQLFSDVFFICVIWEKNVCGERGTCMVFSQNTAFVMLGIFLVTRALNIVFCLVIIFISKKNEAEEERLQGQTNKAVEE